MPNRNSNYFGLVILFFFVFSLGCQAFESQVTYSAAIRAHDDGDYAKAIKLYKKVLEMDPQDNIEPDNALVRHDLGVAYLDSGERAKAQEQVDILRQMNREDMAKALEQLLKQRSQ